MPIRRMRISRGVLLIELYGFHGTIELDFSTSLTTPALSRIGCRVFYKSGHTNANSGMRTEFLFDDLFIQLQGSGRFLSSLRWRNPPDISSVRFDHDVLFKLPSLWGDG